MEGPEARLEAADPPKATPCKKGEDSRDCPVVMGGGRKGPMPASPPPRRIGGGEEAPALLLARPAMLVPCMKGSRLGTTPGLDPECAARCVTGVA